MAKKNGNGVLMPNPFNETSGGPGPESPDISGDGIWHGWDEVQSMHLSTDGASMLESPNMRSGGGILGGPAPGEPNPVGYSTTNQSKD